MTRIINLLTVRKTYSILTPAERRSTLMLLTLMFIGMFLEMLSVGLVIPVMALLTQSDYASKYPDLLPVFEVLGNPGQQSVVIGGMLGLIGVYLCKNIFLAFLVWHQTSFTFSIGEQVSQRLFTIYLRQPYTFHLQRNSAQLLRNVIGEVTMFMGIIGAYLMFLTEVLVLLGLCVLLLLFEPLGTLIVVCVLGPAAWGFHHFTRSRITHWGQSRQHHEGLRIQHLQQGLGGIKDVKLLGRETNFLEQYSLHNAETWRIGRMISTLKQLPRLWLEALAVSGLATLVLTMLAQGHAMESVLPMLALFAAAAFRLMPSVNRILGALQSMRFSQPVIDTLYADFQLAVPAANDNYISAAPFREMLELKQVDYTYSGAPQPALSNLSLVIRRGESVGFIGASGAGKSTLVDIILGLLTPVNGEVWVDGTDIHVYLRNWQNQIGYVPQSIFLTDDTLRRNVAFGLPNEQIDDAAVQHAIMAAQLEEFIASLPDGLETVVGERGVRLSGGQRQRIGIARALYHDPAVLVLDEATSALDAATERGVMQAVDALHGTKTIIIVAHRLSTVEHCDRLYRLEQGRVVEEGKTREILGLSKASTYSQGEKAAL